MTTQEDLSGVAILTATNAIEELNEALLNDDLKETREFIHRAIAQLSVLVTFAEQAAVETKDD